MTKIKLFSVFLAVLLLMSTVSSSAFEYAPEENLGTEHSETTAPAEIEAETGSGTEETETEEIETVIFEYSEDVGGNPNARVIPPGMEDLQPPESDSTTEIVTSAILPDGVYAIESVYAPDLWVDVNSTTSAGIRVWQDYHYSYPTNTFTRSALFKIKYVSATQSYIIRLMTNNMLTLGFDDSGHLITKTLSSPYDSAIQPSETFKITRVSGAYVIQEYGETTTKALASKIDAGGINNIPDSYLEKEYTGTAQDKAKWNFYKYTGVDRHGMIVSYPASLTSIGIPVGSTGTMQNKTWSTVIGSNIPYMQTASGSSDLMSTSFNSTTGEMSYTALSLGYATIQAKILKDSNSTSQYSENKYFQVIPQEGMYIVKNVGANKYIDINGTSTTEGALINQLSLSTEDSQKWIIEHVSNGQGYVRIKSAYSNKYIGVDSTDGTSIKQYSAQNNYTLWKFDRTSSGNLKLVCKAFSTSFGLSAPSNTDGATLSLVSYTNDSDYLDEWVIYAVYYSVNLSVVYDGGYYQRYTDAAERTKNQILALKEKFAKEFGVLVLVDTPTQFASYADVYCNPLYSDACTHGTQDQCANSILYSNRNKVLKELHHKNIDNIAYRISMPEDTSAMKIAYIGHNVCEVVKTTQNDGSTVYECRPFSTLGFASPYSNYRLAIVKNHGGYDQERKTVIHEFGHLMEVADHYGGSTKSTSQMNALLGYTLYDEYCIWGEERNDSQVMSNLKICEGCRQTILANLEITSDIIYWED